MGAWTFLAPRIAPLLPAGVPLGYVGRPEGASPAEGKMHAHLQEQARIVAAAYADAPEKLAVAKPAGRNGVYTNGSGSKPKSQPITELTEQRTEAQTDAH